MHILEGKFKKLRDEQCSYDRILISLNKMWNQLIDDLVLLGVRAGGDLDNLQALDHEELPEDIFESCSSEEIFLLRLLKSSNLKNNKDSNLLQSVEENLAFRHSTTVTLMKSLQEAIVSQQARSEYLSVALNGQKSSEGELEESIAELEESQQKLVVLQLRGMTLASNRLFELHETQEDNLILSKELGDLEGQLKHENYVFVSKPCTILSDQLQHLNVEIERYRGLVEALQNEKNQFMQKENEICERAESIDNMRLNITTYETKIEELERQIQIIMAEKNDLEIKVEETLQDLLEN
ncbi:hypothetical protein PR202_gn00261 [Eleusine coracana subsp. coracana]|uniref:E3 ubiquitin protein ligase n=1 Tax=Eleusine coracana subsp. coracana TaxID=191504 RepID=A0AAV5FZ42_ELECO|nr:hypothetical protein PR202_gn00156 [Eleusine coracana subsp. coracana]GJN40948.1 hypothetical protein PR202_gn00261 [Eleusine coracana subsp. coracana]